MNFSLEQYLDRLNSPSSAVLEDLYRDTWLHTMYPHMASSPLQSKFLAFICKLLQPSRILEIGTFTAYATITMAEATPAKAEIITIEANEEYEPLIHTYLKKSGFENKVKLIIGDAKKILPVLQGLFDLIFLDADKVSYPEYYVTLKQLLRKGGLLVADNTLWSMKVIDEKITDRETAAIRLFNQLAASDKEMEQLILPLRDGISLIRKK